MGEILPSCKSTQIELKNRLASDPSLKNLYWVQALEQTEGRGRQEREWVSPAGNFFFSFLIRGPKENITWIPHSVALSLFRTLKKLDVSVENLKIKWPNDLVWNVNAPQKLAGLLVEKIGEHYVVGVGVNINTAPVVMDQAAISLKEILQGEISLDSFRDQFIVELKAPLSQQELVREYSAHGLFKTGELIEWSDGRGTFVEIGSHGELIVQLPDGRKKSLFSDDVRSLRSML